MLVQPEAHHLTVEVDEGVHLVPAHVAHHVIDVQQAHRARLRVLGHRAEAGKKWPVVILALDESVDSLAVGGDARHHHRAVVVLLLKGLANTLSAALRRLAPGIARIVHPQRHVLHPVAMLQDMGRDLALRVQRRGQHQPYLALLQNVGGAVALPGFRAGIGNQLVAKGKPVVVRGLPRVANVELDIIRAVQRQKVLSCLSLGMHHGRHTCPPCRSGAD